MAGDDVLYDIERAGRSHDGDHQGFVRERGQVMVVAMKSHDPAPETPDVVHAVQQSLTGAIGGDDEDSVAAAYGRQSVHGHRQVGPGHRRSCPSDPRRYQLGPAAGLRLLGQMGHEVPGLTFGGPHHQERITALHARTEGSGELGGGVIETEDPQKPPETSDVVVVHA